MARSLAFDQVTYRYESAASALLSGISFGATPGWTGIVGANGVGKTTLLKLACRELTPTGGTIVAPDHAICCPQRTDLPPRGLDALLACHDGAAWRIRGQLGLQEDWSERWPSLSHGERKRAQLAVALWLKPDLLALDEPTNHLDDRVRGMIRDALHRFRGIGLLVSHDRELLDTLCTQCLFVEPPVLSARAGDYTQAREQLEKESEALRKSHATARLQRAKLEHELARRGRWQAKAQHARSKRGIDRKDSDAKEKIDRARLTDSGAGGSLRQLEARLHRAQAREASLSRPKGRPMGLRALGSVSHRRVLVRLAAGRLALGPERALEYPDLEVGPEDRIALAGPNGSGKSTLVRALVLALRLPAERHVYVPQEISAKEGRALLDRTRTLSGSQLGTVMDHVSRLGSSPEKLLESALPSPGEVRKLLLALALPQGPELIVMDEPTNHMDLPSIECLEVALQDFQGALLLVSHDARFLRQLTDRTWEMVSAERDGWRLEKTMTS